MAIITLSVLSISPWPWYVAGPLIGATMFFLLWLGRRLGISSSMQVICAMAGAGKKWPFFNTDWKAQMWQLAFVAGLVAGGSFAHQAMPMPSSIHIAPTLAADLESLGLSTIDGFAPKEIFSWEGLLSLPGLVIIVLGGFLTGFGARWAGGCTSGHMISGMSELQLPSLIASVCFLIGGAISSNIILPMLF